jgi:oligopeptide transport system substrate-binding protein
LPTAKGLGVQILANIKGAVAVHSGSLPLSSLGIRAINSRQLEIFLEMEDSDFLAKLAHPALAVTRTGYELNRDAIKKTSKTVPVSGPYMIGDWSRSDRIRLSPNPYYSSIRPQRPPLKLIPDVEALIIEDDETAFNLYREGTLSLLRRLPTHYLKAWEKSSELHQIPVIRFDYIGFASDLKNQPHLRQALSKSLRFDELKRLYSALGTPGCPGINSDWMTSAARLEFEKVPEEIKKQKFELAFSKMGGDDIQKGMEWVQAQWKTNLSFQVDLKPTEQSIFINQIRTSPPAVFRKGVGLDRASCLAALEIFQKGDPENYIQFENARYEEILQRLKKERAPLSLNSKKLCSEAIQILIDEAAIIPLGPIYFSILAKPSFQNWVLTPLNQLDLGQLSFRDPEPN